MGSGLSCFANGSHLPSGVGTFLVPRCFFQGRFHCLMPTLFGIGIFSSILYYQWYVRDRWPASEERTVLITGCDTGLGFSLALHSHRIGLTVIAACYNRNGEGALKLAELCGKDRLFVIDLDVTNESSVEVAVQEVHRILHDNPKLQLKALVNNAGVMVFAEFEWQTEKLIHHQVEVNILGTMRVTKAFCSLMRKEQGRIIIINSHCANQSLPGLAVYGGTKAALKGWADGLRVEQAKYGVLVISFLPGSFFQHSNILSKHKENATEMETAMSLEDKQYFGQYFQNYNSYLSALSSQQGPSQLPDDGLYQKYESALLCRHPFAYYVHGPLRYTIYQLFFQITPTWLRDRLVHSFMQMPIWRRHGSES